MKQPKEPSQIRAGVDVGARELVVALRRDGQPEAPCTLPNTPTGHRQLIRLLTRRVLLWAMRTPAFLSMGNDLTTVQRTELKGLEAAALEIGLEGGDATFKAIDALNDKERAYGVYTATAPRPRWQD